MNLLAPCHHGTPSDDFCQACLTEAMAAADAHQRQRLKLMYLAKAYGASPDKMQSIMQLPCIKFWTDTCTCDRCKAPPEFVPGWQPVPAPEPPCHCDIKALVSVGHDANCAYPKWKQRSAT
jgi:hypothetical protein